MKIIIRCIDRFLCNLNKNLAYTTIFSFEETKMYEDEDTTITVTTSAISHEEDDFNQTNVIPMVGNKAEKRQVLDVKKKPLKRVAKHRSNKKGGKKPPPRKHNKGRNK